MPRLPCSDYSDEAIRTKAESQMLVSMVMLSRRQKRLVTARLWVLSVGLAFMLPPRVDAASRASHELKIVHAGNHVASSASDMTIESPVAIHALLHRLRNMARRDPLRDPGARYRSFPVLVRCEGRLLHYEAKKVALNSIGWFNSGLSFPDRRT